MAKKKYWKNPDIKKVCAANLIPYRDVLAASMFASLIEFCNNNDFSILKRMQISQNISNEDVFQHASSPKACPSIGKFENSFCFDLASLLHTLSIKDNNNSIVEIFRNFLYEKYPSANLIPSKYKATKETYHVIALTESQYRSNAQSLSDKTASFLINEGHSRAALDSLLDSSVVFNTGEVVYETACYKDYYNDRITELAEYCNQFYHTTVFNKKDIYDALLYYIRHHFAKAESELHNAKTRTEFFQVFGSHLSMSSCVIESAGGPNLRIAEFSFLCNDTPPCVEDIVTIVFKHYVREQFYKHAINTWDERLGRGKYFTRNYLKTECVPSTSFILTCIRNLYATALLNQCYLAYKKLYYLNFSWDKINLEQSKQAFQETIDGLNNTIDDYRLQLTSAHELAKHYKEQLESSRINSVNTEELRKVEQSFEKNLEDKDAEILKLRHELANKEAYINLLSTPEDETADDNVDMDFLKSKRYLFVGRWDEIYQGLSVEFPNSVFLTTPTQDTSVKVDAVVYLIPCMSHSMFYKVQQDTSLKSLPRIYCNTRRKESVYSNMFKVMSALTDSSTK